MGRKTNHDWHRVPCPECEGRRKTLQQFHEFDDFGLRVFYCEDDCPACKGSDYVNQTRKKEQWP